MTIDQVKEGLQNGFSYTRGNETVRPQGTDYFEHSVSGHNDQGGYGGLTTLPISLLPGNFEKEGWKKKG